MVSTASKQSQLAAEVPAETAAWLESLRPEHGGQGIARLQEACALAERAHAGQTRASGEPYVQHVLAVAHILAELHLDTDTLMLHDTVEDTDVTLDDIRERFGDDVARLVDGVTKMALISSLRSEERAEREHLQAENLRKMLLAMAEDVRVVLIKLADRLHNMRTLQTACTTCAPCRPCRRRNSGASPARPWTSSRRWPTASGSGKSSGSWRIWPSAI